jgi:hypothetical protein
MFYGFIASLCLVPWLWFTRFRRAAVFAVVYLAVTWIQMAALPNTGATLHHVLLLWPFPHFLIATVIARLADIPGRWGMRIATIALAAMVSSNLLLVNEYYAALTTRGTAAIWTDAIYPLFDYLDSIGASRVIVTDWGYSTTLCLLSDGEVPLHDISYALLNPTPAQAAWIRSLVQDPRNLFVQHASGSEQFPAARDHFESLAAGTNRVREVLKVVTDRNHRPRFEIVRYTAAR